MAPRSRAQCQICKCKESKYTCSKCPLVYCSVPCYKQHQESTCISGGDTSSTLTPELTIAPTPAEELRQTAPAEESIPEPKSLRALTSLAWPYVPEESAYPDPLKRDDPKSLQLPQYEAIATSPAVRKALVAHPRLLELLISIDKLRGPDREDALQRALGVSIDQLKDPNGSKISVESTEEVIALRQLAEAVEAAVRGGKVVLGLDWGE